MSGALHLPDLDMLLVRIVLLLVDCNLEGLGCLLAADIDRCSDWSRGRRVLRSEGEGDALVGVAEEVAAVREGRDTAPIEGVNANNTAAVGGIQTEIPRGCV